MQGVLGPILDQFAKLVGEYVILLTMTEQRGKETIGQLVARLRDERDLKQGELATYATELSRGTVRVTRPWIAQVEGDRIERPEREKLEAIARVLRVPPENLLAAAGYRVTPLPERQRSLEEMAREIAVQARKESDRILIMHEQLSPAHMGDGSAIDAQEWTYVPREEELGHRFIVVRVAGDCLAPRIMPGHRVVADKDASTKSGDVVVAEHNGEWVVKILEQRDGEWWLVDNKGGALRPDGGTRIEGVVVEAKYRP